jgi:hypothetical protein
MLRRVALVRTDVSEVLSASFTRVTRIGELGTTLVTASVVPSSLILDTLMKEELSSSEPSVLTRATRRNNPEDTILHSHHRENLKSYILKDCCQNQLRCENCYKSEDIFQFPPPPKRIILNIM